MAVVVVLLRPTFRQHWGFGVGPDEPVYYWWARVGGARGISTVGERPGIPALLLTVAGTLHLPLVAAVAGVQYALTAMVAVVATAILHGRARGGRWSWLLAGLLTGLFAVHLGGGFVANLAFTLPFFAAGAALALRSRRGTEAAALLLGGGGLLHPQFFVVGAVILLGVAIWSRIREAQDGWSSDAGRVLVALAGAGAVVGLGTLATRIGPTPLHADTSKDALLRRAGLRSSLHQTYMDRLWQNADRYAPWVLLPTAAAGVPRAHGFTRRFLVAWATVTLLGVPLGIATGLFPPDRIITFAFALPVLSALGITWLWTLIAARLSVWVAWGVAIALIAVMANAALSAWREQQTFISPDEIANSTTLGRIAATLPPGTPLVVIADATVADAGFVTTQTANILRAAVPPDRAQDVYVYLGDAAHYFRDEPTLRDDPTYDAISRLSLAGIPAGDRATFVLREFDRNRGDLDDPHLVRWDDALATTVPGPRPVPPTQGELTPSSPGGIALATVLTMVLLWGLGYGWSRWAFADRVAAAAAAAGFGVATVAIVGLAAERVGVPLTGSWGPTLVSGLAGGLGYLLWILQGQAQVEPTPEIREGPDEEHDHDGHDHPASEP